MNTNGLKLLIGPIGAALLIIKTELLTADAAIPKSAADRIGDLDKAYGEMCEQIFANCVGGSNRTARELARVAGTLAKEATNERIGRQALDIAGTANRVGDLAYGMLIGRRAA